MKDKKLREYLGYKQGWGVLDPDGCLRALEKRIGRLEKVMLDFCDYCKELVSKEDLTLSGEAHVSYQHPGNPTKQGRVIPENQVHNYEKYPDFEVYHYEVCPNCLKKGTRFCQLKKPKKRGSS